MFNFTSITDTLLQILGVAVIVIAIAIVLAAKKKKFSDAGETVGIVVMAFFLVALGSLFIVPGGLTSMKTFVKSVLNV